jgi:hypothetical protein
VAAGNVREVFSGLLIPALSAVAEGIAGMVLRCTGGHNGCAASPTGGLCPWATPVIKGGPMDRELRLQISEEGADAERLAALAGYLRAELLQLDVADVTAPRVGEPPAGARAGGVSVVGALLVALGQSAEGLQSVVSVIGHWLGRGGGSRRTVRLELGGDVLELSQASAGDQARLIELFVSKHTAAAGPP